VFYSFYYKEDVTRVSQVRQIGVLEGNRPATDNDWEAVTGGGDPAIERWINNQLQGRSCTVVLVGENTANRKWINYEIIKSWNEGMGVVGIYIHGLKNINGYIARKGANPFDYISLKGSGTKLSNIVQCYEPDGLTSKEKYAWIAQYLEAAVEQAIEIRNNH